jgi:hypothetical protein
MFIRRLSACVTLLVLAAHAAAQPGPQLVTVFPPGARAGGTVEVTFSGSNFTGDEKLLFSGKGFTAEPVGKATNDPKAPKGQATSSAKFKVTAPKGAGTFDVRVVSNSGLSNPRAFAVSETTEVNETEPNNDVPQAQKVELETTVNGVISAPTDVDFVSFKAKAGQNVAVSCITSSIDSRMQADIMVTTSDGKQLAANRGYRDGDAVLDFKVPADGDYFVRVAQFAYTTGGPDHFYRLTITTKPWTPATFPPVAAKGAALASVPVAPTAAMVDAFDSADGFSGNPLLAGTNPLIPCNGKNGTAADAQELKLPADVAGRIAKKGERHWYKFDAKKGDVWTLEVFAERIGSPVDAFFVLTDDKGKTIVEQDDGDATMSPNQFYTKGEDPARYRFAVPADGTYRVMVSTREAAVQYGVRDQFVLRIAKENPDFRVCVMPLTPHVPDAGTLTKGGAVVFTAFVFRFDGFADPIELVATNLPKGVTCPRQVIGTGQSRGTLVLTCDKDAADWDGFVRIEAKSGDKKHAVRPFSVTWAAQNVQQNQVPNTPLLSRMDRGDGLAIAVRGEAPFALTPTETKLTTKPGGKLEVTLKVTRKDTFKDAIQIVSAHPSFGPRPQGNQPFPPVGTSQPGGTELKLSVDVLGTLPSGEHTLVLRALSAAPPPKGNNQPARAIPNYALVPITVTVEGGTAPKTE